jgi:hypothetical protein
MKKIVQKVVNFLINGAELKPGAKYTVLSSNL